MLFHASAEKSDPVCETQSATSSPKAPAAASGSVPSAPGRTVQRLPKLSETAAPFQPNSSAARIRPTSEPVLAVVNTFWITLPYARPRVFVHVSSAMSRMPTTCAVDSDSA